MTCQFVADHDVDATGLLCPLPVLKARKCLQHMTSGQVLRVLASDPAAVVDIPHFCQQSGHHLLHSETAGSTTAYFIRCG